MSAYLVGGLDINDPISIADYRSKALPLVAAGGGRLIALDEEPLELEGWQATNMLLIEFPNMDAIRDLFAPRVCATRASAPGGRQFSDHCLARDMIGIHEAEIENARCFLPGHIS